MYTAGSKTDLVSGGFEIDLVYGHNMASLRGGLEIITSAADSQQNEPGDHV